MLLALDAWLSRLIPDVGIIYWLFFANYVLALAFAVSEIYRSRTSQGSIAWILSLLILPFPMTLLYAMFGLKLFDDYAAIQTHSGRVLRKVRSAKSKILDQPSAEEWPVLVNVSQIPFLKGNDVELLIDGEATFNSIFEGISRAQETLLIQFYIIHDDELGREFAARLIERANAGVKIYLLYDDVGCFWLPNAYKEKLRKAGINMHGFNHRHRVLRFLGPTRIQYRNHRKIVLADGKEAWIGGLNVGDEYMGRSKRFGPWRDTHVRIKGPAVLGADLSFREDWQWATGEELTGAPAVPAIAGDQSVLVMPTGPADKLESCAIAFDDVIGQSKERLWIVSPYFVPDTSMETALYAAALRGVDVRILIPEMPDHRIVWLASIAHAYRMIEHGISIYRYPSGFLHQKAILVDDRLAGVGTVNFDNRSFRINFEVTMWFTHEKMIADVEKMLKKDFSVGRKVDLDKRGVRPPPVMRFMTEAARLLSRSCNAMTEFVFRDDNYVKTLDATVTAVSEAGFELDRTIFYAASGGQPADTGQVTRSDGTAVRIANVVHPDGDKTRIVHVPEPGSALPAVGEQLELAIDWDRRYRMMRMHTALHLLSVVFPFPVTGGQIGEDKGRLDFDMPEVPADLPALEAQLNEMVAGYHAVTAEWITDEEMAANPGLVKTMKVKPPTGQGRVRLIRIGDVDLQPCGGTHVANTSEIGPLKIGKIEKKGAQNRRVALLFG